MDIIIETVWQHISPQLASEISDFWISNRLLPEGASANDRVSQVVLVIRENTTKAIVGVTSADHIQFKQLNNNYFFMYRQAVLPHASMPGLSSKLSAISRDVLEEYSKSMTKYRCIGLLTFVENPKMRELRNEAIYQSSGFVYIGNDKDGRHIRVSYFRGATI